MINIMAASRSCKLGAKIFPREDFFRLNLGMYANVLGQYEVGLHEYQEALRLAPKISFYYRNLALTYLLLSRVEDAAGTVQKAALNGADSNFLLPIRYEIAFYRNDAAEMTRQAAIAAKEPGVEDLLLELQADTAAYSGHLDQARELSRRAADSAEHAGSREAAVTYEIVSALREGLYGNAIRARQQIAGQKKSTTGHDLNYALALVFAYAGEESEAQRSSESLAKLYSDDVIQFNFLPAVRAKLALLRSSPQQALEILRAAAPYELGLPALGFYNWPNMYPVYVRGEAYLAAHEGREAAAEFQKILDHRGIVLNEPIGALAHLGLGRAYAMQGDSAKARAAYQDFLTLWTDADPDIPILREAKSEYARVQ